DVEARVGSPEIDNTHKMRENFESTIERMFGGSNSIDFSIDDDEPAIRTAIWLGTDVAFKEAQRKYIQVRANHDVKVSEED
ncbi:hypothetical protein ABTH30_23540, partial [Acinetobacter baumannii]